MVNEALGVPTDAAAARRSSSPPLLQRPVRQLDLRLRSWCGRHGSSGSPAPEPTIPKKRESNHAFLSHPDRAVRDSLPPRRGRAHARRIVEWLRDGGLDVEINDEDYPSPVDAFVKTVRVDWEGVVEEPREPPKPLGERERRGRPAVRERRRVGATMDTLHDQLSSLCGQLGVPLPVQQPGATLPPTEQPAAGSAPVVVSLCTGAMGLDLGLETAGFCVQVACENDSDARATIAANRPGLPLLGDIRRYTAAQVREEAGIGEDTDIDLVAGGPRARPIEHRRETARDGGRAWRGAA